MGVPISTTFVDRNSAVKVIASGYCCEAEWCCVVLCRTIVFRCVVLCCGMLCFAGGSLVGLNLGQQFIIAATTVVVLLFAGWAVVNGTSSVSNFVVLNIYVAQVCRHV